MPRTITLGSIAPASGVTMSMQTGHRLKQPNSIIQCIQVRTDNRSTYASNNSGNGTPVTDLRINITPTYSDSTIRLRWVTHCEFHQDNMFLVQRNGSLIGYNTQRGNIRYSGITTPPYDNNYDSTPHNMTIEWYDKPGTTAALYYDLAVRGSGASNYTFFLNRTQATATGGDNQEMGISYGYAWEITAD